MQTVAGRSVFFVGLRGLLSGRRWLVVAVLDGFFLALALILALAGERAKNQLYMAGLYENLLLPVLLPFVCLLFATEALGGEVDDRTLIYLTLRPAPAIAIVGAKFLSASAISVAAVWLALAPGFVLLTHGDAGAGMLGALLVSATFAALAYCALFLMLGLLLRRALLIGVIYVLFWEGAIAGLSRSAANLSVRNYASGLFGHLLQRPDLLKPDDAGPTVVHSLIVLIVIAVAGVALAAYKLRRVELP
ncbi:MAG: ABC transporter permease [Dehalococcoidia bacterium]